MTPNPGSDVARHRGCTCPAINPGRFLCDGWILDQDCPIHG